VQPAEDARPGLARVLHAEQVVLADAGVLGAAGAEGGELHLAAPQVAQRERHLHVPQEAQVVVGEDALRAGRVSEHEGQLAVGRTRGAPLQKVLAAQRLAVLVDAQEAHVQTEARVLEVVVIAPEEGDVLLRSHHQPHVVVALVAIHVVAAPAVERDHLAAQAGGGLRLLFQPRHRLALRLEARRGSQVRAGRGPDALGHVLDRPEDLDLHVRAAQLLLARTGQKAVREQVALRRAELGELV